MNCTFLGKTFYIQKSTSAQNRKGRDKAFEYVLVDFLERKSTLSFAKYSQFFSKESVFLDEFHGNLRKQTTASDNPFRQNMPCRYQ